MKKPFDSGLDVRWCPGCGDYAILRAVQKALTTSNIAHENMVFVSGIGCASRLPYYLDTYGFHTIHGRAPTIATGVKLTNNDLDVWMITGDGDGLSIGLGHLLHLIRRNIDITVLLFNNQIYGLTKGQASPTSAPGSKTKSTPFGSEGQALDLGRLTLASKGHFFARGIDIDAAGLAKIFEHSMQFTGTKIIEIYQNCHVFNDGAFKEFSERAVRDEKTVFVAPGKPLVFANGQKGLKLSTEGASIVSAAESTIYDPSQIWMVQALLDLSYPDFPVPVGIFQKSEQSQVVKLHPERKPLHEILEGSVTWQV